METSGSEVSSESSDKSTAETASDRSSPRQILSTMNTSSPFKSYIALREADNDQSASDSDSDISMSADTDDDEGPPSRESVIHVNSTDQNAEESASTTTFSAVDSSKKRRLSHSTEIQEDLALDGSQEGNRKRFRPEKEHSNQLDLNGQATKDVSLLPVEIWHHIFTFCPPRVLGSLLRVNKSFHSHISPSSHDIPAICPGSSVQILKPDEIWRKARKNFTPSIPEPLLGKTELDMWKMACGSSCQFCGKRRQAGLNFSVDPWHPGPGENGVVPIWSFGILTCGACLRDSTTKEIDILLSSSIPSPLMAALPFVFVTNELNVISSTTLQNNQQPSLVQITRCFLNQRIEDVKQEFEGVKAMGSATAEEWLKGLDGVGKERRSDASRWERWEASGGLIKMRQPCCYETRKSKGTIDTSLPMKPLGLPPTNGSLSSRPLPTSTPQPTQHPTHQGPLLPFTGQNTFLPNAPTRFDSPAQSTFPQYLTRSNPQPKHERTKEEVAELKAARRAEIERRCLLLDPPLIAGVLAHMASFQAAIQIIQPLSDGAWEVLKPRLLSQREEAEQRESDRLAQTRVVQERFDNRFQDTQARSDSKDLLDKEWEDIQAPLRTRIGGYADETIRDRWNGGDKVTSDNCSLFAAAVLIYVRKRFYAEVAKDEAAVRATGREPEIDPPNGPYTRKLILENMKWIFDTKIKPHTEPHRKEIFLCNACEFVTKYYGFEGVIQHYAAKHTSALSMGSIVVHWKSEWPEHPPFNPDPTASPTSYYSAAPSAILAYANAPQQMQPNYGYGGYQPVSVSAPMQAPTPLGYQESPGPYYGHPQFDQYSGHQNGPYAPPPHYPDVSQGYQPPQYTVAPQQVNVTGYNDVPSDYSHSAFGAHYSVPTQNMYTSPHQGQLYPTSIHDAPPQQHGYAPQASQFAQPYIQAASLPTGGSKPNPTQMTEEYKAQLQELARNAREVWNSIHGVKEVPGSVKVYTIIYHIMKRFRLAFQEEPTLSMIVDGLSNNKDMRPVRNVNGLVCKACSLGLLGSTSVPNKKHFSFPQLVSHFHSDHEKGIAHDGMRPAPDWTRDMVELPDSAKLASVATAPGMDDQKLKLFAEALPEIVTAPVPSLTDSYSIQDRQYTEFEGRPSFQELAPSRDDHDKYYTSADTVRTHESDNISYDNGEYDPRNPGDLPVDARSVHKSSLKSRDIRGQNGAEDNPRVYTYAKTEEPDLTYQERSERSYDAQGPVSASSHTRLDRDYSHTLVRKDTPTYVERTGRYRDSGDTGYRIRRDQPAVVYDDFDALYQDRDYRTQNAHAHQVNRGALQPLSSREHQPVVDHISPHVDGSSQPNRILEVVAKIEHQAREARERQHSINDVAEAGSEDGEVRASMALEPETPYPLPLEEASNAAERFLNEFLPWDSVAPRSQTQPEGGYRDKSSNPRWDSGRGNMYDESVDLGPRIRSDYVENDRVFAATGRLPPPAEEQHKHNGNTMTGRVPPSRQTRSYNSNELYAGSVPEYASQGRSPELVDRRYKLNNVIYRDERPNSTRRTPSRYARYESVRLENDRARSRSPLYVQMGQTPGVYRDRSPVAQLRYQEPIYRSRTPPQIHDEPAYERVPRQEYYRVYADEPRYRQAQHAETFEFVRVADPQGDYMIRRPIRRQPEPIYARYEDDVYNRQPIFESRPPVSRPDSNFLEEYDPRHPEPPAAPSTAPTSAPRPVRY